MKHIALILTLLLLVSCKLETNSSKSISSEEPVNEKLFLDLGGALQYVEIIGSSNKNPILLFIHGGPGWPQTPQLRYYNSQIAEEYTLVIWEQRGAGNSYGKNPTPENLTLEQIIKDGHQLTTWLKAEYDQEKVFLAGYSWGSLVGINLVKDYPEDYSAYIGIAQIVNMNKGIQITQGWLTEQAIKANDDEALERLDSLRNLAYYEGDLDRFFQQWVLLNKYNGTTFNKASEEETEKAMSYYEDYKDYDWFKVWEHSAKKMQEDMFGTDVERIEEIETPIFLLQGRHDWNIPSKLAEEWLNKLKSPKKKLYWFENSGHGPLEEEPKKFNETMIGILAEME
ncbi:alpha/beta fold hydrolase [Lewinella cohaerens]|uniref:alpha/beta fold hydrolase n=1 Tax=Lewinella cohaerens TaxID=70995 RepID=UPI00037623F2|nr:alpha/beta hydrolase [Lewinella cohaerens]